MVKENSDYTVAVSVTHNINKFPEFIETDIFNDAVVIAPRDGGGTSVMFAGHFPRLCENEDAMKRMREFANWVRGLKDETLDVESVEYYPDECI